MNFNNNNNNLWNGVFVSVITKINSVDSAAFEVIFFPIIMIFSFLIVTGYTYLSIKAFITEDCISKDIEAAGAEAEAETGVVCEGLSQISSPQMSTIEPLIQGLKEEPTISTACDPSASKRQAKPFHWFLRWNLPDEDLQLLTYSEKACRFYLLSNFGEAKEPAVEVQLLIKEEEERSVVSYQAQEKGQELYQEPEPPEDEIFTLLPHHRKHLLPLNFLSDLINQTVDISVFQVILLRLNHELTRSVIKKSFKPDKRSKKGKGKRRNKYALKDTPPPPDPALTQCQQVQILHELQSSTANENARMTDPIIPGTPLNREQLRNILSIIL